ncbi:MAG: hypothetical protein WDN48_20700 [Pseudolabrys sp.]
MHAKTNVFIVHAAPGWLFAGWKQHGTNLKTDVHAFPDGAFYGKLSEMDAVDRVEQTLLEMRAKKQGYVLEWQSGCLHDPGRSANASGDEGTGRLDHEGIRSNSGRLQDQTGLALHHEYVANIANPIAAMRCMFIRIVCSAASSM